MSYNKISQYTFYCDVCNDLVVFDGYHKVTAERIAREDGWKIGKLHYCPKHRRENK